MFIVLAIMAVILFVDMLCSGRDTAWPTTIAYCFTAALMVGFYIWSIK